MKKIPFILLALFALFPLTALAQYYYYDSPRYGVRYADGQAFYYLLPSQSVPVYYNGAIYPTGYPYPTSNYGYALASAISVSCAASPLTARVGEEVLWYSSVTGGAGNYTYSWSGADGLFGTQSTVRKAYATAGDKYATVTVTSGGQSIIAGCSQIVRIVPTLAVSPTIALAPRLGASCYAATERVALGESTTWLALISGASPYATTTYKWDGTDELSGDRVAVFRKYATNGLKHAVLTVTSGGERVMTVCTNAVTVGPSVPPKSATIVKTVVAPAPLQGICGASVTEAPVGDEVLWQTSAVGGAGAYSFAWKGTDELTGDKATTSKKYETEGKKIASVKIVSGNKDITVACGDGVEIIPKRNSGQLAAAFFAGFGNPVALILLALLAIAIGVCLATRKDQKAKTVSKPAH